MARRKPKKKQQKREVPASVARVELERLLTPAHWTQVDLATALGITGAAVGAWLRREARPSDAMRSKIEKVAGIPASAWDEPVAERAESAA